MTTNVEKFNVKIAQSVLDDLTQRLAQTRWPDEIDAAGWQYGANSAYLKKITDYWQKDFDWRKQEDFINSFANFRANIAGMEIHFIHERGKGSKAVPIVLLHGWPSSFYQMLKITPLLTQPRLSDDRAEDCFDVIIPSLPGYGFSDRPTEKGMSVSQISALMLELLIDRLGYEKFILRASDMGAGVAKEMALSNPEAVIGLHLSGTNPYIGNVPSDLSSAEQQFVEKVQKFQMQEFAYAMMQSTKPQTLAFGLNDSPVGLAAWIIEKFRAWSDCDGNLEKAFSKDELLANLTIYWATETINSSIRLYYESAHSPSPNYGEYVHSPTAIASFPKDMVPGPREWAEREYNIVHWAEMPRGGHFGEWEEPELLADDIWTFYQSRELRQ
ncbi:epoxide hydrolase family protein [cf. Phormidesmis sp. LEGE 11477]|uniref:epoxide hydrolase family protein n=1 Tax=cf. Phormidesmis sp. LEGE 11477 TaxID=1828680 RepID=UPI00187EC39A|nr:epoxide hydrolase family protein [cf. Phormidesmis sp. LEGE 11477]MBE9062279.1 epoxide hydrolase [cf. Phormidesmis sp. LEGE 11477]